MMTSINTVVVRLSRLAEMRKVAIVIVHSSRFEFLVRIHSLIKSKQPLLLRISIIVIVASRNITIAAALPTYFRKMVSYINSFTALLLASSPARKSIYSCGCSLITKSVP